MSERAQLDDRVFRELRRKLGFLRAGAHVKVGVLASKGGAAVHEGSDMTLTEIAAVHEFGSPAANIPERSFIRGALQSDETRDQMGRLLVGLARGVITEKLEVGKALDRLGAWAVGRIKARIKAHIDPPLKPETIERKTVGGKTGETPLIDTGQLINSITWEVKEK